jgi:hypothetical protein
MASKLLLRSIRPAGSSQNVYRVCRHCAVAQEDLADAPLPSSPPICLPRVLRCPLSFLPARSPAIQSFAPLRPFRRSPPGSSTFALPAALDAVRLSVRSRS